MAKKVTAQVKLQIPAGKATPAPPVGTALGPQGVNIMDFCKAFNAKTSSKDQEGLIIPVVITIFSDRSFTFITKTPPVPVLIKRAVNLAKGSPELATLTTLGEVGGPVVVKPPVPERPAWAAPPATADWRFVSRTTSVSGSTERGASTALPSAVLAPQPDSAAASAKSARPARLAGAGTLRSPGRRPGSRGSVIPAPWLALAVFAGRALIFAR